MQADAADLLRHAVVGAGDALVRLAGRAVQSGPHETRELAPALQTALVQAGIAAERVRLTHRQPISNWTRVETEVDLIVLDPDCSSVELAAELKVWDIGHQLFDLAKLCCLLEAGVPAGFLLCVAYRPGDFDRKPGGVLFPPEVGEVREHSFRDLIESCRDEWRLHVGRGSPEPTCVPTTVTTSAVAARVDIAAYPGHSARAVQVEIADPTPVRLTDGFPSGPR